MTPIPEDILVRKKEKKVILEKKWARWSKLVYKEEWALL